MKRAIVITPNDEVKTVEYKGYETDREVVEGIISHVPIDITHIETPLRKIPIVAYCNDEGLLQDTCCYNKVNAFITALYGYPIYGNVIVLEEVNVPQYDENGEIEYYEKDSDGFDYKEDEHGKEDICDCRFVEDAFLLNINHNRETLAKIHAEFDNNKPQPEIEFISLDDYLDGR